MNKYIVGIDEAGRGPLAGPVAVGICMVPRNFDFGVFGVLRDSKKLSEKRREELYTRMYKLRKQGELCFSVVLVSAKFIDQKGISKAIRQGILKCLARIGAQPEDSTVYLDGGLKAPICFAQETIIKGDEKIPVISLASIAAKVIRDRYMKRMGSVYPQYGFEVHKGYGTSMHQSALKKFGLSRIHRRTFCKKIPEPLVCSG